MGHHTDQEKIDAIRVIMKIDEALSDLLDGMDWTEIQAETGMPADRCKEIVNLTRHPGEYSLRQMMGLPKL